MEYKSPVVIVPHILSSPGWLSYWGITFLSVPTALFFIKRRKYSLAVLLTGTLGVSLLSMRYIFFFVPLAAAFDAFFLSEERSKKDVYLEVLSEIQYWRPSFPWVKEYEKSIAEAKRELGAP